MKNAFAGLRGSEEPVAQAGFYLLPRLAGTNTTATCTGNKLAGGARITASTNTADATCAACTGTADFGPANGASDCVAVNTAAASAAISQ